MPSTLLPFTPNYSTAASRAARTGNSWWFGRRNADPASLTCTTERELERWATHHLHSLGHERRVMNLATDLFNLTHALHGLGTGELRLLRWASLVHDVGRAVCDETHPKDGARLIDEADGLNLSRAHRRQLRYLTLYHRGKPPALRQDKVLNEQDDPGRMLKLLALLRAADALDNRALARKLHAPPSVVFSLSERVRSAPALRVRCYVETLTPKAQKVYRRKKKFRLLEVTLGVEVSAEVIGMDRGRAVA